METLIKIVQKLPKDNTICSNSTYIVKDSWKRKLLGITIGFGKYRYIEPLQVIETEKSFYIDRRPAFKKQSILSIIPSFLIGAISFYFAYTQSITVLYFFALIAITLPLINMRINNTDTNVLKISKEWIKEIINDGDKKILIGILPAGVIYTMRNFRSLNIPYRLGDKISKILNITAEFTITLNEVNSFNSIE